MDSGARAQSEVLGTALLLGITVISIALIVTIAGSALDTTRDTTDMESAEHAMSQLDSRAALVALGRTDSQTIDMGRARSGAYGVNQSAGSIEITHLDYDGAGTNVTLYEAPLGKVVYQKGDSAVAYQGGGVWRSDGSGGSVLVSPPEFHYRGETLTIPVIRVDEGQTSGSASGQVSLEVRKNTSTGIYPGGGPYPNGDPFANPIQNGSIRVSVQSEYYRAWGSFFRSRSEGQVRLDHANETATVELVVPAVEGEFRMPLDGDSVKVRTLPDKHTISDLNVTVAPDDSDSANFANLKWSLYAESGSEQLELHLRSGDDMKCGDGNPGAADATIYYTDGTGTYQGWTAENAFPVVCNDLDDDGTDEARLVANWTSSTTFTYSSLSSSDLLYFNPSGSLEDPANFTEHGGEDEMYSVGDSETSNYTVGHYTAFFSPTLELTVADSGGGGGTVNEDVSSGRIHYGGGNGAFVTYIHATENRVNVTVT